MVFLLFEFEGEVVSIEVLVKFEGGVGDVGQIQGDHCQSGQFIGVQNLIVHFWITFEFLINFINEVVVN